MKSNNRKYSLNILIGIIFVTFFGYGIFLFSTVMVKNALAVSYVYNVSKISDTSGLFSTVLTDGDEFGISVNTVGDVDGNGVVDLAVGAWRDDDGGTDQGAFYILKMNSNGTVGSYQKFSETAGGFTGVLDTNDEFGSAVVNIGDLNNDGYDDYAVGARADDDGGGGSLWNDRGAVYILFMNASGTVASQQKISDTAGNFTAPLQDYDIFGTSILSLGDVDGDGIEDIAVSALNDNEGGTDMGAIYVLYLNLDGTVKTYSKIFSGTAGMSGALQTGDGFGHSIASIGDLNKDGVTDWAVGVPRNTDGGPTRGGVLIMFMNADFTVKSYQMISDTLGGFLGVLDDNDRFGSGVANMGDINGDGVTDIAVGAWYDDDGGTDKGATYIVYLNVDGTANGFRKISDTSGDFAGNLDNSDYFGFSVASTDFNNDGIMEVMTGAFADDDGGINRGAIYIMSIVDAKILTVTIDNIVPTIDSNTIAICNNDTIASTTLAMQTCASNDISSSINLLTGSTELYTMVFQATDGNSVDDLVSAEMSFYKTGVLNAENCTSDNNNCYGGTVKTTCTKATDASGNTTYYKCPLSLEYYTDETQIVGSWTSYVKVTDLSNAVATATSTESVNKLISSSFSNIDFLSLPLAYETPSGSEIVVSHVNNGNTVVDFDITGDADFTCDNGGTIPASNVRFDASAGKGYANSLHILDTVNAVSFTDLNAPIRTDDNSATAHTDYSYWSILIPGQGILGNCSASITAIAVSG